jgi:hypothetical protein
MALEVVMKPATVAQMTVRACGAVLIVLGILIWTGHFDQFTDVHKFFGIVLVLGLWTLAFLGARAGVPTGLVVVAVVWGLIAPALGLTQENILVGGWHWVVQVLHLLIGLGAIGLAERLGSMIKARPTPAARLA